MNFSQKEILIKVYTSNNRKISKALSLFLSLQWPKGQVEPITSLFKHDCFAILIVTRQYKLHFWNSGTKVGKIDIFF